MSNAHTAAHYDITPGQCSPGVHHYYATQEQAQASARAKSRDGKFYSTRKCPACTGWRLVRRS